MTDGYIIILLVIFTGIVAAALLIQCLAFLGIARSIRQISLKVDGMRTDITKSSAELTQRAGEFLATVKSAVEGMRGLQESLATTSEVIQKRVIEVDALLGEASDAARLQIARIQDVVDTASRSVEETFEGLHRSVIAPVREIHAILAGIRVGLDVLLRRRSGTAQPTHRDGELFI